MIAAFSPTIVVPEGSVANNSGTFSDAEGNGTVALTASVGTVVSNVNGTWTWSFGTNDGPSQSQVVTITATDNTSSSSQTTFNLTVNNVAPSDGVAIGPVTYTGSQLNDFVNTGAASYPNGAHSLTGSRLNLTVDDTMNSILYRMPLIPAGRLSNSDSANFVITADWDKLSSDNDLGIVISDGVNVVGGNLGDQDFFWGEEGSDAGDRITSPFFPSVGSMARVMPFTVEIDVRPTGITVRGTNGNSFTLSYPSTGTLNLANRLDLLLVGENLGESYGLKTLTIQATGSVGLTNDGPINEGSTGTMTFSTALDPSTVDTSAGFHYAYDFDNNGTFEIGDGTYAGSVTSSSAIVPASYLADGPGTRIVRGRILDKDGGFLDDTTEITILNVAPTVTANGTAVSVNEGMIASNTGTMSDPGIDTISLSASIGSVISTGSGTWSWALTTSDGPAQSQTVTITATDSDGASSQTTFSLTVNNAEPTAIFGSAPVNEGSSGGVSFSGMSDPSSSDMSAGLRYSYDFNNDGLFEIGDGTYLGSVTSTSTPLPTFYFADGPLVFSVRGRIIDKDEGSSDYTATIVVNNVAPTATLSSGGIVIQGNDGSVAFTGQSDPSSIDTSAGFHYAFDFDNNGSFESGDGTYLGSGMSAAITVPASFLATAGAHVVRGRIIDKDDGFTDVTTTINVGNAPPIIAVNTATITVNEGQTATNSGTASDPGGGAVAVSSSIGATSGSSNWTWLFATNDGPGQTQTVTVTATDANLATASTTFSLVVLNVAPTATFSNSGAVPEGSTGFVSFSAQTDVSSVDTSAGFRYAFDFDNNGTFEMGDGTYAGSGTPSSANVPASFLADGPASRVVRGRIIDKDNGFTDYTTTIDVNNVAPTVTRNLTSVIVNEGNTATNTGTFSDPGVDTVMINASIGTITQGSGAWSWSFGTTDGPAQGQTVTIIATDSDGATSTTTFGLVVNNVVPTATFSNGGAVNEGSTGTVSFSAPNDPSSVDTSAGFRYAYDFDNNGTFEIGGSTYATSSTAASVTVPASFLADGPATRTVRGRIYDKDGGSSTYTTVITINNVTPTVNINTATVTVNEGQTATNSGTVTEPGVDTITYSSSAGAAVPGVTAAVVWTWSFATNDGPGQTQTVTITATDSDGAAGSATFNLVVNNVAPTGTFSNGGAVNEGSTGTVSFSAQADVSSVDTSAGFRYAYDFDNNGSFEVGDGTYAGSTTAATATVPASFLADGPASRVVRGRIVDKDNGVTDYTTTITINNVTPSVAANNATVTVNEGATATNSGTFSDPGVDTVTITASIGTISQASGTWSWSFGTNDGPDQTQTVTISATDSDGAVTTTTFNLVVNNVAPSVAANNGSVTVNEGATATNSGTFGDPGLDTVAITASVGTITQTSGTWSWSFGSNDGPDQTQTVTITATDSDGAATSTTFNLAVNNVAPSVAANNATVTVNEAATATNSGTWSDPGLDVVTLVASAGSVVKNNDGTWSWSFNTNDGPDQTQPVTITATDSDGAVSATTFNLVVNNVAPSVAANNASVTVSEGATATNSGSFSDPGLDTVAITASIGTITQASGTWSWSFGTNDGPDQTQTVTITATDSDGSNSTTTFNLVVNNVAPSVTRNNATVTVNEGASASNSGTWSDPGLDVVTLTASAGSVVKNNDGTWSWSFNTNDGPDQTQTVTITATDNDGAASTTTFNLVVNNVAPSVARNNATVAVNEGATATNTGTWSDPGVDVVTLTASAGSVTKNNDGTWSWSFGTNDGPDQTQTVTITATDSDGAVSTTTFNLVVNNVAPSVTRNNATMTVNEGATATNSGTFSDPGLDTVAITASVGTITQASGTWSWSFGTNDGPDQTQLVTITATDSDGAVSTTTFNLVVNNVAPSVARNNATVTVNEGAAATNSGTFSDPGLDTVAIAASIGTITQASGTWSWSFGTNDGPAEGQTVTITATDSDGAAATTTFVLVVSNVAPTATLTNGGAVNEGTAGSVNFSAQTDVSSVDTSAGFRYAFDFDNNGTFEVGSGTYAGSVTTASATVPASFLVDGPAARVVRGRILDKDGGFTDYTTSITINNVAPAVASNNASVTVNEGATAANSGTFSDPGVDVITVSASVGTVTTGSGTWSWSFGTNDGPAQGQTVTITATDSDGAATTTTFTLGVNNVAPTATLSNGGSVNAGSNGSVSFSGQSDPSSVDTTAGFRYAYDFDNNGTFDSGNGTYAGSGMSASATVSSSYLVGTGAHVIRGRIIDKDGGSTDYTTTIIVNDEGENVPPVIVSITNSSPDCGDVLWGDPVIVSAAFTDANPGDTHTAVIDWGDGTTTIGSIVESNGLGTITGSHAYATGGFFTITVTVTDSASASDSASTNTVIAGVQLLTGGIVLVIGTDCRDHIVVHKSGPNQITVDAHFNQCCEDDEDDDECEEDDDGNECEEGDDDDHDFGSRHEQFEFVASSINGIVMYLCGGDDHAVVGGSGGGELSIPVTIYGESGDDHLNGGVGNDLLDGGTGNDDLNGGKGNDILLGGEGCDRLTGQQGNDVLVGGAGSDVLQGDAGRDILIGGSGADDLKGGNDDDVLVAGSTSFDSNVSALSLLRSEWTSSGNYAARVANLVNGTGTFLNGTGVKLKNSGPDRTVFNDAEKDTLSGQGGSDLFFASLTDLVKDKTASETLMNL